MVVLLVLSVVSLALVDPLLMLVGLALFPALGVLNHYYSRRVEAPASRAQAHLGQVAAVAHESFDGALVVKSLGLEEREVGRMSEVAGRLRGARLEVGRLRAVFEPGLDDAAQPGHHRPAGHRRPGGCRRAPSPPASWSRPWPCSASWCSPCGSWASCWRRCPARWWRWTGWTACWPPRSRPAPAPGAARRLPAGPLAVDVTGLHFGYGGDPVLAGLDLRLTPGEVVALVGATGSGKSTLCHLLSHLHRPERGVVRMGGVDLAAAEPASVRAHVALAFQETFLFADTVRENLTLGEPMPDGELRWALERARADRFVDRLPGGIDQMLGERGVTLSGGQRQRLALARALLRRPGLLMLDDATSAVDATVERQILDGLRTSLHATTLIVAHRISTIALADRVLFLDGGRVVASGSHADLLATVPAYAALARAYEEERRVTRGRARTSRPRPGPTELDEAAAGGGAPGRARRRAAVGGDARGGAPAAGRRHRRAAPRAGRHARTAPGRRAHAGAGRGRRRRQAGRPHPHPADPRQGGAGRDGFQPAFVYPACAAAAAAGVGHVPGEPRSPTSAWCGRRRTASWACGCGRSSTSTGCRSPSTPSRAAARSWPG